jgi:hypothetical protein
MRVVDRPEVVDVGDDEADRLPGDLRAGMRKNPSRR